MPFSWRRTGRRILQDFRVFRVREDRYLAPRSGREIPFFVIESGDWINILPITKDGRVVFIRQYRAGTERETLEIPGGLIEPGEDPLAAAHRELREETGFEAGRMVYLGAIEPNPAIQSNRCHTYLAEDCSAVGELDPDEGEEITVELRPYGDVAELLYEETITHALVAVAFQKYELWRKVTNASSKPNG